MSDVIVVAVILAFFGLCVGYCAWCDRIIGADPQIEPAEPPVDASGDRA